MGVTDMAQYRAEREQQETPHIAGEARCLGCGYEWVAVTPAGEVAELACPACDTRRGVLKATCGPAEGEVCWECNCGCDVYRVTPDGVMCLLCGVVTPYSELAESNWIEE